jgi:hypothetical protein
MIRTAPAPSLAASAFALALLSAGAAAPQSPPDPISDARYLRQLSDAMYRTLYDRLTPELWPLMSARERRVADEITFDFPRVPGILAAFADRRGGERIVVVSAGHMALAHFTLDASLLGFHFRLPGDEVSPYIDYLAETATYNQSRALRRRSIEPFESFEAFAGLDAGAAAAIRNTPEFQGGITEGLVNYLGFVVAHEIGHHVHGDVDRRERSLAKRRVQEAKADAFAMKMLAGAGYNPFVGLATMTFFAVLEGDPAEQAPGDHPPAICRSYGFIVEGLALVDRDRGFADFVDSQPHFKAQLARMRQQLASVEAEAEAACGKYRVQ